ncbi:MAG: RcnB family protein [Methylobacillus glycogenes]|nr:RcnB family protein [Methylobacillus glycogenes]
MPPAINKSILAVSILSFTLLCNSHVWADPPHGKGNGGPPGHAKQKQHKSDGARFSRQDGVNINIDIHFSNDQRTVVHEYYHRQYTKGHCPPGLAKKNNGCLPPGQAKKWRKGYPLPRDVIYYDLPPVIIARLDPPPRGYKYVRVAADILMIAIGTGMVIDAIEDLGNL